MPPRSRLFFIVVNVVLFLILAFALSRDLAQRSDIWWTPRAMLVPLNESQDRVEIYVRGRPVVSVLAAGQLQMTEATGPSVLAAGEIGLRFNNWDRVRAGRLPLLLAYAAGCGATATLILLLVTGRLAYRGETEKAAA